MMTDNKLPYLHALVSIFSSRLPLMHRLLRRIPNPPRLWDSLGEILPKTRVSKEHQEKILRLRASWNVATEWEKAQILLQKLHAFVLTPESPFYPPLLKEIPQPPSLLYGRGSPEALTTQQSIAVVGTRRPTAYGRQVVRQQCSQLASAGWTIVSGMAYGIDGEAHRAALAAGGPTIAVLGASIDESCLYPQGHTRLAHDIIDAGGVILSEYGLTETAHPHYFPERNRIIAGISPATLVVEAAGRSGSLITATYAIECGRDVFAVPGQITQLLAEGTNQLIAQGATPWLSCASFLPAVEYKKDSSSSSVFYGVATTPIDHDLFSLLAAGTCSVDTILAQLPHPPAEILERLTFWEMQGAIIDSGGQRYYKT